MSDSAAMSAAKVLTVVSGCLPPDGAREAARRVRLIRATDDIEAEFFDTMAGHLEKYATETEREAA